MVLVGDKAFPSRDRADPTICDRSSYNVCGMHFFPVLPLCVCVPHVFEYALRSIPTLQLRILFDVEMCMFTLYTCVHAVVKLSRCGIPFLRVMSDLITREVDWDGCCCNTRTAYQRMVMSDERSMHLVSYWYHTDTALICIVWFLPPRSHDIQESCKAKDSQDTDFGNQRFRVSWINATAAIDEVNKHFYISTQDDCLRIGTCIGMWVAERQSSRDTKQFPGNISKPRLEYLHSVKGKWVSPIFAWLPFKSCSLLEI